MSQPSQTALSSIAKRMQAAAGQVGGDDVCYTTSRIADLIAVIEHHQEHRRLVIARPDRPISEDELAAFRTAFHLSPADEPRRRILKRALRGADVALWTNLVHVSGVAPAAWHLAEFRWIELEPPLP